MGIQTIAVIIALIVSHQCDHECGHHGKFSWGFQERFRVICRDNTYDLNSGLDDYCSYVSFRTKLWAMFKPAHGVHLYAKLTNAFFKYFKPEDVEFDINEVVVDNLYLHLCHPFDLPIQIRIGRQDLNFGEQFIMGDGTPGDGSRTVYHNAVRIRSVRRNNTLDLFYTRDLKEDKWLPVINNKHRTLNDYDEWSLGFYGSHKRGKRGSLEFYFIHREIESTPLKALNCLGGRLSCKVSPRTKLDFEGAIETGSKGDSSIFAYGGYFRFTYALPLRFQPSLGFTYLLLSGDDPETDELEGWDPMFGRWPKWSKLYIYLLSAESGPAYWSNFKMFRLKLALKPIPRMKFWFAYSWLGANAYPGPVSCEFFGYGKTRGSDFFAFLGYRLNRHLSGYVLYEVFNPGDFYVENADPANYFRMQIVYEY